MITSTPLTKGKPYIQPRRIEADSTVPTKIFPQLLRAIFLALAVAIFGGLLAGCLGNMLDDPIKAQGDAKAQVDGRNRDAATEAGADATPDKNPSTEASTDKGPDQTQTDGSKSDIKDGTVLHEAAVDGQKPGDLNQIDTNHDAKADGTIPGSDAKTDGAPGDLPISKEGGAKTDGNIPSSDVLPDQGPDAGSCSPFSFSHGTGGTTTWNLGTATNLQLQAGSLILQKAQSQTISNGTTFNTLGTNSTDSKTTANPFNNAKGTLFNGDLTVQKDDDASSPYSSGFSVIFSDNVRELSLTFFSGGKVCEPNNTGNCTTLSGTQFSLTTKGNSFTLKEGGTTLLSGPSTSAATTKNTTVYGDQQGKPDAQTTVTGLSAESLDYKTSGTYLPTAVEDTKTTGFNWTGTTIQMTGNLNSGSATIAYRTADTISQLNSANFSGENSLPFTFPAGTAGRYLQWRLTAKPDTSGEKSPQVTMLSAEKKCP